MILFKICGLIFVGLCGAVTIKLLKPEYSYLVILSTGILCLTIFFNESLTELINKIRNLSNITTSLVYTEILFKALGIGYLTVITSEICKKAGEEIFSDIVETAGKFEILALCIPMATEIIETARGLL